MRDMTQNVPPPETLHDTTDRELEQSRGPFRDEAEVVWDRVATHDDLSKAQSSGDAAAKVSAEHVTHLQYRGRSIFDARSSPHGAQYYPDSLDSLENRKAAQQGFNPDEHLE